MKNCKFSIFLFLGSFFISSGLFSQGSNVKYERVKIGDAKHMICGLALSPDKSYLAISSNQSYPFYEYNWDSRETNQEFNVGNWYAGSSVKFSDGGRYILLQKLFYIDLAPNKDREVSFEVVDANTGSVVKRFDEMHAVAISPDESYVASLTGDRVTFWSLPDGHKIKSMPVNAATNGLAISPDGKSIAISVRPTEDELKSMFTRLKKDKKAYKASMKYKQLVKVFDIESGKTKYTVKQLYDIVYRLEYTPDGNTLFCLQIPHVKAGGSANAERLTYVNTIDPATGAALRKGFTSKAIYEPEFKLSPDGKLFGIVSKGARFLELHIYDFETGKMLQRFEQSFRLFEKNEGRMIGSDTRMAFAFLPDNQTVAMTMGNHLVYWKLNL